MNPVTATRQLLSAIRWRELGIDYCHCPACDRKRLFLRFASNEVWVRCTGCHASTVTLSLISVLRSHCQQQMQAQAYEMSARGALYNYLKSRCSDLVGSEFIEGVKPGSMHHGIRCEDVQALSFDDEVFDLVTSTEVFEHVPDDQAGFREVCRVLKTGGCFVFTVPLHDLAETRQRVRLDPAGRPQYLLPAEYHSDPAVQGKPVLTYRDYGTDITASLRHAGFSEAMLVAPQTHMPWGYSRRVIVARKASVSATNGMKRG